MTNEFLVRTAQRKEVKLKIGFAGPSGSGKTYSALQVAYGMTGDWTKIAVLDTENQSADLYSHFGAYKVLHLTAPFHPNRYVQAIKALEAAGAEVIIVDSITHEWEGPGGCLALVEQFGGRYQDWAKVTPLHTAFLNAILSSPCHVFTTVRKKQDYAMTQENNKVKVQKVGLKEITREGFEYEVSINFDINQDHYAVASKDRTGLFSNTMPFIPSNDTGHTIKKWNNSVGVIANPAKERAAIVPNSPAIESKQNQDAVEPFKLESPGEMILGIGALADCTYNELVSQPNGQKLARWAKEQVHKNNPIDPKYLAYLEFANIQGIV